MSTLNLSSYKPASGGDLDAGPIANAFDAIQAVVNALDNNNIAAGAAIALSKLGQSAASTGSLPWWNGTAWAPTAPGASAALVDTGSSVRVGPSGGNVYVGGSVSIASPTSYNGVLIQSATAPAANPTGGGILYVESGALKYRGPGGTITTLAAS